MNLQKFDGPRKVVRIDPSADTFYRHVNSPHSCSRSCTNNQKSSVSIKKVAHEYLYPSDSDCNRYVIDDYLYDLLHSIVANHSGSIRDFPASRSQQSLVRTQSVS